MICFNHFRESQKKQRFEALDNAPTRKQNGSHCGFCVRIWEASRKHDWKDGKREEKEGIPAVQWSILAEDLSIFVEILENTILEYMA